MENSKIHIGEKISEVLSQQHKTKRELGEAIGMSTSASTYLTTRKSVDAETLWKISLALKVDFFKYYPVTESESESESERGKRKMVEEKVFDVRDKTIEELKTKLAECEKLAEPLKRDLQMQKQENVYLKKINELLDKK